MRLGLVVVTFFVLSFNALAEIEMDAHLFEIGTDAGVDLPFIKKLASECKVSMNVDTTYIEFSKKYYINYKGDSKSTACFYDGMEKAVREHSSAKKPNKK